MTARPVLVGLLIALCAAGAWAALVQHRRLAGLRAEYRQVLARISEPAEGKSLAPAADQPTADSSAMTATPSSELLQLRSQVSRLTEQKRELANARLENDRLRAQLASRGTNTPTDKPLPPDYIRKSQAQWVGMNTPENTLQSFLWALQNRDLTNLLQLLTPEARQQLTAQMGDSPERFFNEVAVLPGMRLFNQQQMPDGSIAADLEVMPGADSSRVVFRLIDGQWKMQP